MTAVEPIRDKKDIKRIEDVLIKESYRNLLLFDLGINLGLRISDILALNVYDVKDKNVIKLKEKKTGKYKTIPINIKIKKMLFNYTKDMELNTPLFVSAYNNRLDRFTAYRIINNACKKANIELAVGTHTLRKTFGYHFYKKYNDIVLLQKIFNHSNPAITLRYIGIEQNYIYDSYKNFIL